MKQSTLKKALYGGVVAVVTALAVVNAASSGGEATARSKLTLMAPAAPGGGWDGFAREGQQALKSEGIVNNAQVVNVPGAGGTIGLSQFVQMPGRHDMLMATGAAMVGAVSLSKSDADFTSVEMIARVADDYSVLVVPANSPYETLGQFVEDWKADPGGTSIAGGSLGSIDHLITGLVAEEIGIDPAKANYIAYSGDAIAAILSGTTDAGITGYNEVSDLIEAGQLRALAVSSEERLPGADVPTFIEQGVDAYMANWRGYAAAPGVTQEQKQEFVDIVTELRDTEHWQSALERNRWVDNFMTGEEFEAFIAEELARTRDIVEGLGL
ncbi:Bug family tripartite tricarboxylate transporter substrate binding protein [Zafaria sp. Z1313]|uniref:Bug family tripartite tricarboxylate transporter substrate binding protein n=1 Tax=Zafaria sp. Z1313 TaxID=3423202 RepID=UPI003D302314